MKLGESKCKINVEGLDYNVNQLIKIGEEVWRKKKAEGNFIGIKGANDAYTIGILLYCLEQSKKVLLIPREMTIDRVIMNLPQGCLAGILTIEGRDINWVSHREEIQIMKDQLKEKYEDGGVAMFTTGSTGKPKVVYHTLKSLIIGGKNILEAYQITSQDKGLGVLPVTHMNGLVTTLVAPIISNSSVVFYSKSLFTYLDFVDTCSKHKCTWFSATPYYLKRLLETYKEGMNYSGLRFIRSASSALDKKTQREASQKINCPVYNSMGMTEAAGQICSQKKGRESIGNVGYPINIKVRVKYGNTINNSGEGELIYKGDTIIDKYLFKSDNIDSSDGWLMSGDDGYIHNDGSISIKGRLKNTINFCGIKFNAEEIEEYILREFNIESAAMPIDSNKYGQRVILYIEDLGSVVNGSELNGELIKYFGYKELVKTIYRVERLERFPNRKLNKIFIYKNCSDQIIYEDAFLANIKGQTSEEKAINLVCSCTGYSRSNIDKKTSAKDRINWDSLATLSMICSLEETLERKIQENEYSLCESVEGISCLLEKKSSNINNVQTTNRLERGLMREFMNKYKLDQTEYLYLIGNKECIEKIGFHDPFNFITALEEECRASNINLIMNSFTWKFCEGLSYSANDTRSEMGLINEIFRTRCKQRTESAIYPYSIMKYDESLTHEDESCWGKDSTCQKLLRKESCSVINIGVGKKGNSLLRGNTCLHALEEIKNVPYREFKTFTGLAKLKINQDEYVKHSEKLFVRSNRYSSIDYEWGALLERIKDYRSTNINHQNQILKYHMKHLRKEGYEIFDENIMFPIDKMYQERIIHGCN